MTYDPRALASCCSRAFALSNPELDATSSFLWESTSNWTSFPSKHIGIGGGDDDDDDDDDDKEDSRRGHCTLLGVIALCPLYK